MKVTFLVQANYFYFSTAVRFFFIILGSLAFLVRTTISSPWTPESKRRSISHQTFPPGVFSSCLPVIVLRLFLLTTDLREPVHLPIIESTLMGVTEVLYPSEVVLLRRQRSTITPSPLFITHGQESLCRAVLMLWKRFYSRLIPLWAHFLSSPIRVCVFFGFGVGAFPSAEGLHHAIKTK